MNFFCVFFVNYETVNICDVVTSRALKQPYRQGYWDVTETGRESAKYDTARRAQYDFKLSIITSTLYTR